MKILLIVVNFGLNKKRMTKAIARSRNESMQPRNDNAKWNV